MRKLKVNCLFKDTFVWQAVGIEPSFEVENNNQIVGVFPDTPDVREAIHKFLRGESCPNILDFVTRYKLLRAKLYSLRDSLRVEKGLGGNHDR